MSWTKPALEYFAARAIAPEVAAELGVRENGHGLEFPYPNGVAEQFARTRSLNGSGPKVRQPVGTRLCPWQPVPSDETREVLVCEGESDLLAAVSALRCSERLEKKPRETQAAIMKTITRLAEDPRYPGLHTHKVRGVPGVFESYIDQANRLTWEYGEGEDTIILRNHCNHAMLGRP